MAEIVRRPRTGWADLMDWFETGFPTAFRTGSALAMRAEEAMVDGRYVLRVEAPGVKPEDVDVTIEDGRLTVRVERQDKVEEEKRSEFHYGVMERMVTLPPQADESDIQATYRDGILEISVGMMAAKPEAKHIKVAAA